MSHRSLLMGAASWPKALKDRRYSRGSARVAQAQERGREGARTFTRPIEAGSRAAAVTSPVGAGATAGRQQRTCCRSFPPVLTNLPNHAIGASCRHAEAKAVHGGRGARDPHKTSHCRAVRARGERGCGGCADCCGAPARWSRRSGDGPARGGGRDRAPLPAGPRPLDFGHLGRVASGVGKPLQQCAGDFGDLTGAR